MSRIEVVNFNHLNHARNRSVNKELPHTKNDRKGRWKKENAKYVKLIQTGFSVFCFLSETVILFIPKPGYVQLWICVYPQVSKQYNKTNFLFVYIYLFQFSLLYTHIFLFFYLAQNEILLCWAHVVCKHERILDSDFKM